MLSDFDINKEIDSITGKPTAYTNRGYPYNELPDRTFELLLYSIFKKDIEPVTFR